MKKYFLYELRKNLVPIIVLTGLGTLIYITYILNMSFGIYFEAIENYNYYSYRSSPTGVTAVFLCILCTFVPVMTFSHKMNKRAADSFYSMPLRREKLYLIKSLTGLLIVLIPYTISYWLGFAVFAVRVWEHSFNLVAFVPLYFLSLPLAFMLFGINSFAFSRANSIVDGVIFIAFFTLCAVIIHFLLAKFIIISLDSFELTSYSGIAMLFDHYSYIITNNRALDFSEILAPFIYCCAAGAACWAGLFICVKTDKAENAEQISNSWFGYKVFLPFYIAALLILGGTDTYIIPVMAFAAGFIGYLIYRRSFIFGRNTWLTLIITFVAGLLLAVILPELPYYGDPDFPDLVTVCLRML